MQHGVSVVCRDECGHIHVHAHAVGVASKSPVSIGHGVHVCVGLARVKHLYIAYPNPTKFHSTICMYVHTHICHNYVCTFRYTTHKVHAHESHAHVHIHSPCIKHMCTVPQ